MNKIYVYFMGVFCWLNATIAQAVDKFEILPDLPDPLAYAVQPASASTVSGGSTTSVLGAQSIGQEPSIISVVFSLLIVVLLIYITGIIYAKLNNVGFKTMKRQQGELAKSQVSVISTTPLGSNKTLHVVELDGKRMLIGASSGAIQLLKDLGSANADEINEEYSHIEIPNIKIPKIEIPKIEIPTISFAKLRTKTHKPIKDLEETETCEEQVRDAVNPAENENSEEIIDSLFAQTNEQIEEIQEEPTVTEHKVDPDEYALYKKYLS
ncbi:MAG: hypothetical protein E7Z92_07440 [Cyanobacteria bacterium SIG31]|nr:hypothetical protein [Cyanobacteria bacterium SIG31]